MQDINKQANTLNDILNKLPSSAVNNSRDIVRRRLESFNKSKSESKAMAIEAMTGEGFDFKDEDNEWSPRQGRK